MAISYVNNAFAYTAATTTPSITHGLTLADGDVLVALISNINGTELDAQNMTSTSSRFTRAEYAMMGPVGTYTGAMSIWARYVTTASGEDASYAWAAASSSWSLHIFQFSGVDAAIWDVTPAAGNTKTGAAVDGTTLTAPDITIIGNGAMGLLLAAAVTSAASQLSAPTNSYGNGIYYTSGRCQGMARRAGLSTGAVGASSMTIAAADDYGICQCALKYAGVAPTLSTTSISAITATTASSGGTITSEGSSAVTQYGVVWATHTLPVIESDDHTHDKP